MGFRGDWSTSFGQLHIEEAAGGIQGTYACMGGRIEGAADGRTLRGTWIQPENSRRGPFEFVLDEHGGMFDGVWSYAGDQGWRGSWDGARLRLPAPDAGGFPGGRGSYEDGPLLSGPMLGEVSETSARIWAQGRAESRLALTVRDLDGAPVRRVERTPAWSDWLCTVFVVDGLPPDRAYTYEIAGDDGVIGPFPFRLAKPRGARRTTLAFGSCFADYASASLPIFDAIGREGADAFVMLGDTTYFGELDWQTEHTMMLAHLRSRNNPSFRQLVRSVPTLGVWDDHDFGPNNADGQFEGREAALSSFRRCWVRARHESPRAPGIFASVRAGAAETFLLDSRTFKNENERAILGQAQMNWLVGALIESDAPVKLVASPTQVLPEFPVREGWESFRADAPTELATLLSVIEEHAIRGVVFLSGDLHMGNLIHVPPRRLGARRGPDFWELTASPLANEPAGIAEVGRDPFLVAEVIDRENYGLVDIDLDRAGAELILRLKGPDGSALVEQPIALATLSVR